MGNNSLFFMNHTLRFPNLILIRSSFDSYLDIKNGAVESQAG